MTVTWNDFKLNGQDFLSLQPLNERHRREAIRCFYYSIFHACNPLLKGLTLSDIKGKGSHEKLTDALLNYPAKDLQKQRIAKDIGRNLVKFKRYRTDADYGLNIDFDKDMYNQAIKYKLELEYLLKRLNLI